MSSCTTPAAVRVAVVQTEPEWLDLQASVKQVCKLIEEAGAGGAKLIAFPECFVPGYPVWIWTRAIDSSLTTKYIKNSLSISSPEMKTIQKTAAAHNVDVVLGFSENDGNSLYMAQCTIAGSDGEIKMKRRKLKPTHLERTIFGDASGSSLQNVVKLPYGNVGALMCWEHLQPLLKYHTYLQREEIHVAAWPALDKFVEGEKGHWGMSREGCTGQSQQYAAEGGVFVLHSTAVITERGIEKNGTRDGPIFNVPGGGCSAVFGPDGRRLTEPMAETEEGLVYTDLDLDSILEARSFVDVCGHYSRPDMLWLGVDSREKSHLRFDEGFQKDSTKEMTSKLAGNEDKGMMKPGNSP